jgi:CRISPR-associated protein Cmr5
MTTLQQKYAASVYERVSAFGNEYKEGNNARKEYGAMAHKLPVLVRQAGLIQALVFVETRGKKSHKQLLTDLANTLGKANAKAFYKECQDADLADYIWLTRQTLAALEWYKRFAESVLNVKAGEEGDDADEQ